MQKTGKGHRLTFQVPNRLVLDVALSYSAKRMGAVLYSRRNAFGSLRKSLVYLAKVSGLCVDTARKALKELEAADYVQCQKSYSYSERHGRLVYAQNNYFLNLDFKGGYTRIPRDAFDHRMSGSAFAVYLYLHLQAGNCGRAFPSLRKIGHALFMAVSTVCVALRALGAARLVYAEACRRENGSYACNSYFVRLTVATPYIHAPIISFPPPQCKREKAFRVLRNLAN